MNDLKNFFLKHQDHKILASMYVIQRISFILPVLCIMPRRSESSIDAIINLIGIAEYNNGYFKTISSLSIIFTMDLICSSVLKILLFLTQAIQKRVFDYYVAKCIFLK